MERSVDKNLADNLNTLKYSNLDSLLYSVLLFGKCKSSVSFTYINTLEIILKIRWRIPISMSDFEYKSTNPLFSARPLYIPPYPIHYRVRLTVRPFFLNSNSSTFRNGSLISFNSKGLKKKEIVQLQGTIGVELFHLKVESVNNRDVERNLFVLFLSVFFAVGLLILISLFFLLRVFFMVQLTNLAFLE